MLRKDLLRVSRAGGEYRPQFVGRSERPLAAKMLGVYREHVGETRGDLDAALADREAEAESFKLVRGLAALLDRDTTVETRAPLSPERARRAAFEAATSVGVADESERREALSRAGDRLGAGPDAVAASLYADREPEQVVTAFDPRWDPDGLLDQYNLSLAQTALFDATEVCVQNDDPRALVSAVKRLGLLYEVRHADGNRGREVVVTGPDALFGQTRRYGTAFARLLRSVAGAGEWSLTATVDDRGTERTLRLSDADVTVPGVEPLAEPTYDSGVEADFAARFGALDLDWVLIREPDLLAAGEGGMVPDFGFDYAHADFRVYFEIMGFWTPDYVEKKLEQLEAVEDVELLVAVDESLGVGEDIEELDHRVIPYRGTVRVRDVVAALGDYEDRLVAAAGERLPDELRPAAGVTTLAAVAADRGVSEAALERVEFPDHERVGRTLLRPAVLAELDSRIEAGMAFEDAEAALESAGVSEASPALSALGYRVEWEGLGGGTLRKRETASGDET